MKHKHLLFYFTFFLVAFSFNVNEAKACHAIALVNYTQQNPVAGGIQVTAASDSPTCGCTEYWLDIEVRCMNDPFNGGPFSPGFYGPLNTYPFFQSGQMLKPSCVVQNYPWVTIPYTGLCPGITYQYRMRENHNGQAGPWTPAQTFTVPGVAVPLTGTITANTTNICLGNCANLTASVTGGCNLALTYTWDNGLGTGSTKTVCPTVTTTYTVTIDEACSNMQTTQSITINVVPPAVAGTATVAPNPVCLGSPVTLTLTGSAGNVQWQQSTNGGGSWTNIAGATTTTFNTAPLMVNTCFRAEVTGCSGIIYSNMVCVTVNPAPTVDPITNITVCNSTNIPASNFTSTPVGATFNWTNDNTGIGLGANGTGNIAAFTGTNTTANPITANISVTANSGGCTGPATTYTITVNPTPTVDPITSITVCNSANIPTSNYTSPTAGTTFTWTNDNTTIGLAANGTGDIASFIATNTTTAVIVANITVTPTANGCVGTPSNYTITVNPSPTVNPITNITVCNGANIPTTNFTSPTAGATFDWTNDNVNIGLAANGTGNIAAFTGTNTTANPITATISVTANSGGCVGLATTYTITVNPTPTVVVPANLTWCAAATVPTTNFTSPTAGTTFTWTNDNTTIGLAANGTGDIASFIATNTTTAAIVANITVTPTANGCVGTPSNYAITVNPSPTVNPITNITVCNGANIPTTNFTSPTAGATFDWTNDNTAIGLGANGTGNIATFTGTNTTASPITANISVTGIFGGCVGFATTYTITVNPTPTVVVPANLTWCAAATVPTTNFTSPTAGATFNWTNDNVNIGLAANGTGDIASFTATNTTTAAIVANITVTPTANGCVGTPSTYTITVNPSPTVNPITNITVCNGDNIPTSNYTSPTTGATFTWTNDNTAIGLAANGTGDITSFIATNTTTAPITANITVTPTANSCTGTSSTYSITVNPTPTVVVPTDTIVCDAATVSATNFISPTTGTTFTWTNDNVNIGLAANGTGDIASFTATNTTTAPITANITVTPTANSCVGTSSTYTITVHPLPTPNFTFTNVCFGTTTGFTDLSNANGGTLTNWNWDFTNNGSVDNTTTNPTNGYPAAGSYAVELMVQTALGCKDSITKIVTVNPIPVANFSATDVCLNTITSFSDSSSVTTGTIQSYFWDFANGSGTDTLPSPTYLYTAANTYNVSLTVTSDSGCIHTVVKPVVVFNNPIAAFTTADVCQNLTAYLTDQSNNNGATINQWNWDIDFDGVNHTTDYTSINATNNYAIANIYTVELIVTTTEGCSDTITNPITIFPMPNALYSFTDICFGIANNFTDNSTVSSGTITNWNWNLGDTNTSILQNPSELYNNDGQYNVTLIVATDHNCKDTLTQTVTVYPLPVVDFTPTDVCLNFNTPFSNLSTVNLGTNVFWEWNFDDGTPIDNSQNPIHAYTNDGTYQAQLIVTTNYGCQDSLTKPVTVNPLPQVNFVADAIDSCTPVVVNFTDNSVINAPGNNVSWQWNFGDAGSSTQQNPNVISFTNSSHTSVASYGISLTVISDKGCVGKDSIANMINSYPIPTANFTYGPAPTNIYDSEISFTDNSIIASQWLWDLGDGTSSTEQNPVHLYADSGLYTVILYMENIYGCEDTTEKIIKIDPVFVIWIPNTFTPDGDDVNDFFFAKGYGIKVLEMLVFDRWGEKIFEGYQLDSKWDGVDKGNVAKTEVYSYKIRAKDVFEQWHEFIGKVSLIR